MLVLALFGVEIEVVAVGLRAALWVGTRGLSVTNSLVVEPAVVDPQRTRPMWSWVAEIERYQREIGMCQSHYYSQEGPVFPSFGVWVRAQGRNL